MDDFERLEKDIMKMEKFPTRFLTAAVKKSAQPILLQVQMKAPIGETGNLIKSIVMIQEKAKAGKRVMEITYDRAFNDRLVKMSLKGKRSYYPASQEYGWELNNGTKTKGKRFMRDSADANDSRFKDGVIKIMMGKIEKQWRN